MGLDWDRKPNPRKKLTSEVEQAIVDMYLSSDKPGANTVASKFRISKKTVYNVLNSKGVGTRSVASRRREKKVCPSQRLSDRDLEISRLHHEGMSPMDISRALGTYDSSVRYSLAKQGLYHIETAEVSVRQKRQIQNKGLGSGNREVPIDANLRHDAFDSFDEFARYWVGFLLADGSIHLPAYGNPRISLRLQTSDKAHLETLKEWLGTCNSIIDTKPFTFGKVRESSCLSWSSKHQATFLKEVGVVPHKEGRFVADSLKDSAAFWRGLMDGDGCVYLPKKGTCYLSGQPNIIDAWDAYCEKLIGEPDVNRRDTRETVSVGLVRHKAHARIILHALYKDAKVFLPRKMATASVWQYPSSKTPGLSAGCLLVQPM
jgi:hypothetical protein